MYIELEKHESKLKVQLVKLIYKRTEVVASVQLLLQFEMNNYCFNHKRCAIFGKVTMLKYFEILGP